MRYRILVTDGEQRAALAVVRSLGAVGHDVLVASSRPHSLAGGSRFATAEFLVPDPLSQVTGFIDALAGIRGHECVDAIFPVAEPSVLAILDAGSRLGAARVPFADAEHFRRISNKALLINTAREVGIAVPAQVEVPTPHDFVLLDSGELRYPIVVKPARSIAGGESARSKFSVSHAASPSELAERVGRYPASAYPLLLQQRVIGLGVGIFLLVWNGELRAVFAHRRLREKPPSGGVSVYRESIPAEAGLVVRSRALLDRFDWQGVAMIEYKVDAESGTPYLMEINGRFWGSLQLAIDAGVDFPVLLLDALFGEPAAPLPAYRNGVRSRWWWGDVDHLLARLRRSDAALALPPGSPSRGRAMVDFLTLWRPGDCNEVLRLSDPRPFFRETCAWFRNR